MVDVTDRATEHEEEIRADALAEQARRAGLEGKTVKDSAKYCACGAHIPLKRRQAIPGVQTCVECQERLERSGRSFTY